MQRADPTRQNIPAWPIPFCTGTSLPQGPESRQGRWAFVRCRALGCRPAQRDPGIRVLMAKILLVEDHEEIWDFLSRRLKRRGYEVILAHDLSLIHI